MRWPEDVILDALIARQQRVIEARPDWRRAVVTNTLQVTRPTYWFPCWGPANTAFQATPELGSVIGLAFTQAINGMVLNDRVVD